MTKKLSVNYVRDLRTGKKVAIANGGKVLEGGRHTIVIGPKGRTSLPRHSGDYPKGLMYAIRKQLIAIGLGALAVAMIVLSFGLI